MTNPKIILNCAFLLALILSCEIVSSEARQLLKAGKDAAEENKSVQENDFGSSHARILQSEVSFPKGDNNSTSNSSPANSVDEADGGDDFRSTTPGRSPGVGHRV